MTSTPLVDRFHFMARAGQQTKTPIRAEAPEPKTSNGTAVLRLYDPIDWDGGFWGVSAKEFTAVLDELGDDVDTIELHVNSPGGMVWDGLAIMNALRQHQARVVVIVDGIAASAASFIAMAGDEVVMAQGAEMMIHSPFGLCVGNAQDMAKMAKDLDHETDNLARIYQSKAGGELDDWRAAMAAETWYSAEEAVAAGLADRVLDQPAPDQPKARFDLSVFAFAGRDKAPAPKPSSASAAEHAAAGGTDRKEPDTMSDTLIQGLRERLGFADDADEATVLASLDEALAEQAESKPDEVPAGHVVVPEALLNDLKAGASTAAQVAKKIHDQERESFLDSVRTKFAPANRTAWAAEYDRDPEATKAHFADAPEIVALTAIGHEQDTDTVGDALYAELFPTAQKGA